MSKCRKKDSIDLNKEEDLDLVSMNRGLWLVKLPKYVAERWERETADVEVAKLIVTHVPGSHGVPRLSLYIAEEISKPKNSGEQEIPRLHSLEFVTFGNQDLGVYSTEMLKKGKKLTMEGTIIRKAECHPGEDNIYLTLKNKAAEQVQTMQSKTKMLKNIVNNFLPTNGPKYSGGINGKRRYRLRLDEEVVRDMLFKAFEKHQYYRFNDLVIITGQPIGYLKQIMRELCNVVKSKSNRFPGSCWELKPEYRSYSTKKEIIER